MDESLGEHPREGLDCSRRRGAVKMSPTRRSCSPQCPGAQVARMSLLSDSHRPWADGLQQAILGGQLSQQCPQSALFPRSATPKHTLIGMHWVDTALSHPRELYLSQLRELGCWQDWSECVCVCVHGGVIGGRDVFKLNQPLALVVMTTSP